MLTWKGEERVVKSIKWPIWCISFQKLLLNFGCEPSGTSPAQPASPRLGARTPHSSKAKPITRLYFQEYPIQENCFRLSRQDIPTGRPSEAKETHDQLWKQPGGRPGRAGWALLRVTSRWIGAEQQLRHSSQPNSSEFGSHPLRILLLRQLLATSGGFAGGVECLPPCPQIIHL